MCSKFNNYKIEISYDGSHFHGFQKQSDLKTVQSVIEESIDLILENYKLNYAGRTDAGVHAKSQIISLSTSGSVNTAFLKSLDSLVGPEIKIKKIQKINNSFHPRFDAKSRVYKYFLQSSNTSEPYNRNYSYLVKTKIELNELKSVPAFSFRMPCGLISFAPEDDGGATIGDLFLDESISSAPTI